MVKFSLVNPRSLKANEFIIRGELDSSDAEFAVITETWLKNVIDHSEWSAASSTLAGHTELDIQSYTELDILLDQIYSVLDNPVTVFSVTQDHTPDHNIIYGQINIPRNATITRTVV